MNKTEFIAAVAEASELPKKDAAAAVDAITTVITEQLKAGEVVQIMGFGTFDVTERAARTGRNPATGEEIQIAASKAPRFKAGKNLKDAVKGVEE
jgi:DNA-binding protein HU-beta